MKTNRIQSIDTIANRTIVANTIVAEMNITRQVLADYVSNYLQTFSLEKLLSIGSLGVYSEVKDKLITEFLEKYRTDVNVSNALTAHISDVLLYFEDLSLNELYDMSFVTIDQSATDFEDYMKVNVPDVLPNYDFDVDVDFTVDNFDDYTVDKIKSKVSHRIGKGAKYKWGACELIACVVTFDDTDKTISGRISLHIKGNATYTYKTIQNALDNRLGANAKRRKWSDFHIVRASYRN